MKTDYVNGIPVRCWDAGKKWADRYTVLYTKHGNKGLSNGRGMSSNPFSPNGCGMYIEAYAGTHLGKRIPFSELPEKCKKAVEMDLKPNTEER